MKKNVLKKLAIVFTLMMLIVLLMTIKSNAASLSISTSKKTVSPGESFTVTVTLSNGAGSVSSGGQTQWLDNSSFSYTKTAGSSGTMTISASGTVADYTTEQDQNVSASTTVSIVVPSQEQPSGGGSSSGNNNSGSGSSSSSSNRSTSTQTKQEEKKSDVSTLSSISIEGQAILPEFDADVREYIVNVSNDITSVTINTEPTDSKASVTVEGNESLVEGENTVTITVTAEDGSTSQYIVKVIRGRQPLALKSLVIKYTNKDGKVAEIPLSPSFNASVLDYTLEELEYFVSKLEILAEANLPNAEIKIIGADNLVDGENVINITLKYIEPQENLAEGEEAKEEIVTYTIKVNRAQEPSFMDKVKDKIKGIFGGIATWYDNYQGPIVICSLCACLVFLLGLLICIAVDYQKYQKLLEKLAKVEQVNTAKPVKVVQSPETNVENDEEEIKEAKSKTGKHF